MFNIIVIMEMQNQTAELSLEKLIKVSVDEDVETRTLTFYEWI